jgi:hypothetical protein
MKIKPTDARNVVIVSSKFLTATAFLMLPALALSGQAGVAEKTARPSSIVRCRAFS